MSDEPSPQARKYARRLRRYEAEARVVARDEAHGPLEFYSPFGPMIAKVRVGKPLLDRLNALADTTIGRLEATGAPERQRDTFVLPERFVFDGGEQSLAGQTARWIARYLATADDRDVERVRFESFWLVRHFSQTFSPAHFHSGDISGVLYLKVPDSIANEAEEEHKNYVSARRAGYITFLMGGKQQLSKSLISFKPEVGDFYIFPGWLLHAVEPFLGEGERRSLAFNAFLPS